jgi:ATP-dependent Lhr-like helicase
MGRTGRRPDSRRNCLFLTTSDEAFLMALAVVHLWRTGYVEPVIPPPAPWHLVAQQAMALVLQHSHLGLEQCRKELARLFPELDGQGMDAVLTHMLAEEILWQDKGLLGFGRKGEELYGRQNFLNLLSSFDSPVQFLVRNGTAELGYIDPILLKKDEAGSGKAGPQLLLLAGRSWAITGVDFSSRTIWVEVAKEQGKARWLGSSRSLSFALCQAVKNVLMAERTGLPLSKRGHVFFEELQSALPAFSDDAPTLEHLENGACRWWTFAGGAANGIFAAALRARTSRVVADDFYLEVSFDLTGADLRGLLDGFDLDALAVRLMADRVADIKFSNSLPPDLLASMVRHRLLDEVGARFALSAADQRGLRGGKR